MQHHAARPTEDESAPGTSAARLSGFTWVEVMLAIFLLGIGLLAIAPVFLVAAKSSAAATDLSVVSARATRRMEILRQIPFDELEAGGDLSWNAPGFFDASDSACLLRWRVADDAAPAMRKTITVLAQATRRAAGLQQEVQLTMVRAR